jgi:zinc protease
MQWTTDVHRLVLPNGLTALVRRDASAPVVATVTHVRAGYFDEPDDWVGIAHVLEHMFFKGTARRGPGAIARETQTVGGYINAGTIYDKTVYYTVLPAAAAGLAQALDIQADALMHAALDPDELRRELEVIIQEAKRKLDSPRAVASETLFELLFCEHRMRRWRIGTEDGLRRLTHGDVREYYESRYTPDRVIVGLVGDLDPDRALHMIADTYGAWALPPAAVEGSPPEPDHRRPAFRVLRGDVERPLASIGWRTVAALHADAPALDVASVILGAGRGSRLYRRLRAPGLAASATASHYTPTEVGVFDIDLEAEPDRVEDAVEQAMALVGHLAEEGPTDAELRRARALLQTGWSRRMESMDGRATALCEAEALGDYRLVDRMAERTLAVSAPEVQEVVARWLGTNSACGVLYLPRNGASPTLEQGWPPRVTSKGSGRPSGLPAPARRPGEAAEALERRALPDDLVHWQFAGIDVLARPKRGSGSVTLLLHFPGVPLAETSTTAGLSSLLARTTIRGAGGLTGEVLAAAAESLGGTLAPSVGSQTLGWSLTVAPGGLPEAAALLRSVAVEPHLEREDITVERSLQASDARRQRDDMFRYPLQRVRELAFPEHPYGLPGLGVPEVVEGFGEDQVRDWAGRVRATRPVAVVVGDVDVRDVTAELGALTRWEVDGDGEHPQAAVPVWRPSRAVEERDKQQTALALAFPAAPYRSPDRFPLRVVGTLLSGLAGRLFDELREKRSLAYTVAAMPWVVREAGAVLCYIATSPEREGEAREAMLAELERLSAEPPNDEELARARAYAAGLVEIGAQSGRSVAGRVLDAWVNDDIAHWADAPERLREVSRDEVARVAASVFQASQAVECVVRGAPMGTEE